MKRHSALAVLCGGVAVVGALAGCGDSNDKLAKSAKIAMLLTTYTDYQQAEEKGVKKTLRDGDTVKVFNANFDPQKAQRTCQDVVSSGRYNVIILNVFVGPTGVPCVKLAKAAGIPVVALDAPVGNDPDALEPQTPGVVGGVYATPAANAKNAAALVAGACEGQAKCRVIVEMGTPGEPFSEGALDAIKKVPNVDVVATVVSQYDPAIVAKNLPGVLVAHPDAQVYIGTGDNTALAAVPPFKDAGLYDQARILGQGGSAQGAKAIEAGTIYGSSGSWPIRAGEAIGKMAHQALEQDTIEPTGIEASALGTPTILNKESIGEFTAEW